MYLPILIRIIIITVTTSTIITILVVNVNGNCLVKYVRFVTRLPKWIWSTELEMLMGTLIYNGFTKVTVLLVSSFNKSVNILDTV